MALNPDIDWLLNCDEPWTKYNALKEFQRTVDTNPRLAAVKMELIQHPKVRDLISAADTWGDIPIKRHNDASHPIYMFSTLADFGLKFGEDAQLDGAIEKVLDHQAAEAAFQSVINIPKAFGGDNQDHWTWIMCDTPTLLYALLSFGLGSDSRVQPAIQHLIGLVNDNGWRCVCDPLLGKFRGPGRKADPCPIANVYALKALSLAAGVPLHDKTAPDDNSEVLAIRRGIEMLLHHWEHQTERKIYMFGIGTNFRKLKYPFIWYDILHVVEVLSRYPQVHTDPRYQEMLQTITTQSDEHGHYTASSMYISWKGWSFANKKEPSPWLTFLVLRILQRSGQLQTA